MPMLTIALAQINPTIGDIDGNLAMMVAAARAGARGRRAAWSHSPSCR